MEKRKHVRDLAPFASSEDLSDERESPLDDDLQKSKLSNIEEEVMKTPPKPKNLNVANVAPRIDISRASSSSHQEDSSPERELYLGRNHEGPKLEVAFGEEMTSDLHSSTEELSFQEIEEAKKNKRKKSSQMDLPPENYLRKDSACSDIALLSISGRTSRVSSVGSVASGGSGASCYSGLSHCSAVSRLSATSNLSRGSSPHRMSVETSFCGPKPVHTASLDVEETAKSLIDKLQQKTEVACPNTDEKVSSDEKIETRQPRTHVSSSSNKSSRREASTGGKKSSREHSTKHKRKKPALENPKTQKFISLHSDEEEEPIASRSVKTKTVPSKPLSEPVPALDTSTQIYIPLKCSFDESTAGKCEPNPNSPKRLKPFTNSTLINFIHKYDPDKGFNRTKARAKSATEVDYKGNSEINQEFRTFISLKDDDDCGEGRRIKHIKSTSAINTMVRSQEKFILENNVQASRAKEKEEADENTQITVPIQVHHQSRKSATESEISESTAPSRDSGLPKYLMTNDGTTQYIPLRGSDSELQPRKSKSVAYQNNHLSVSKLEVKSRSDDRNLPYLDSSTGSDIDGHLMPSTLELSYRDRTSRSTKSMTQLVNIDHSRTPSPNTSTHKHNNNADGNHQNTYLFRRCSESAKEINRIGYPKSRSGSFRSLFTTIFKRSGSVKHKKNDKSETPEISTSSASTDYYDRFKTRTSEPDTIIIPLHSPDEVPVKELQDRVVCGVAPLKNINNTNINGVTSKTITTTVKMEYSEEQIKPDCGENGLKLTTAMKSMDDKLDRSTSRKPPVLTEQSPDCHQVQCEVTIHHSEGLMSAEIKQNEKLVRTETMVLDSSDGLVHSGDQEPSKTDADSGKNSLLENRVEILSMPAKEATEDDGGGGSTDSDKGPTVVEQNDEEYKKLVSQEESFEELPYVPTTLPLERSVALPIIPIKERVCEIRTCSVDRPRSGTPINPTLLETYVNSLPLATMSTESSSSTEKLHITLPRASDPPLDNPRKKLTSLGNTKRHHSISTFTSDSNNNNSSPPPLPPRKSSMSWILFDETGHGNRQSPRRITTLPSTYGHSSTVDREQSEKNQKVVLVNPDDCSCECHESTTTFAKS